MAGINQCKQYNNEKAFVNEVCRATIKKINQGTCSPSIAPTQFGNCHFSSNSFAMDNHFPLESGRDIYSSRKLSIINWYTSATILDIDTSLTRYWYIRLLHVSPVAKNRSVIANFSSGDIRRRKLVVFFVIYGFIVDKSS